MKFKITSLLIALSLSFVLYSSPVKAEGKIPESTTITVDGESAIVESQSTAEKNAISEALRSAVESTTGVYLMSETKVRNFQTLSDEIYTKANGFVSEYDIISKSVTKDSVKVKIRAKVSLEPLVDSLKKLGLLRKWTIAVIMSSGDINNGKINNYSESALTEINEIILDNGFRVVDQDVVASLEKPDILKQINSGNYLAASRILKDSGVDILVVAKTYTEEIANSPIDAYGVNVTLNSAKGRIEAKLIRADTAELLATRSFEGKSVGAGNGVRAQALKEGANTAGIYLVNQIMKLPASTSSYIQLSVKNISFAKAKEIVAVLKTVKGIRKVTSRGYRNNEAIYEVESDGDVNLLADNLSENAKLVKIFKLDITTVSSGKIETKLGK